MDSGESPTKSLESIWHQFSSPIHISNLKFVFTLTVVIVVFLVWSRFWKRVLRHPITLVHELGHVVMAIALGGNVKGIRLSRDTSGISTISLPVKKRGTTRPFASSLVSFFGYPAPYVMGAILLASVWGGYSYLAVCVVAILMGLVAILIRNWWGVLIVLIGITFLGGILWLVPIRLMAYPVLAVGVFLVIGGFRGVLNAVRYREANGAEALGDGQEGMNTDSSSISNKIGVSPESVETVWVGLWVAISVGISWLIFLQSPY